MKCPACNENLDKHDHWIDMIQHTRSKPPKAYLTKYRMKECFKCKKTFYVKGTKKEIFKGD